MKVSIPGNCDAAQEFYPYVVPVAGMRVGSRMLRCPFLVMDFRMEE